MRFLVDECISPLVVARLAAAGHNAFHVHAIGLTGQPDSVVLDAAAADHRILVTLDTDFGALIAHSQAELLLANLDQFTEDLTEGAVVVIGDNRVRVRRLPIEPS